MAEENQDHDYVKKARAKAVLHLSILVMEAEEAIKRLEAGGCVGDEAFGDLAYRLGCAHLHDAVLPRHAVNEA